MSIQITLPMIGGGTVSPSVALVLYEMGETVPPPIIGNVIWIDI